MGVIIDNNMMHYGLIIKWMEMYNLLNEAG